MPEIHPFRALHYDPAKVGDLSKVISEPYDKIDDVLRETYYGRHPNNAVRLDKRKDEPGDSTGDAKYAGAAKTLQEWRKSGVLVEDSAPGYYAFNQTYRVGSETRTRKGLCAMVRVEEPGKGKILPHEETHAGPKIDRLKLLRATHVHFGHIFLLYSDRAREINGLVKGSIGGRAPDLGAVDDHSVEHTVWRITDAAVVAKISASMKDREAIIADGHHRYETAWNFSREVAAATHVMATLVNMDDEGLTCFGTHRVIKDKPAIDRKSLFAKLAPMFDIREYPHGPDEKKARASLVKDLAAERVPAFGLALPGEMHAMLRVRDVKKIAAQIPAAKSEDWRTLDNNILHSIILEGLMGITPDDTAHERFVDYHREADDAVGAVLSGKAAGAFLVNPVTMAQIQKVVSHGERFPQKSTDFYPKIITGLIMSPVRGTP